MRAAGDSAEARFFVRRMDCAVKTIKFTYCKFRYRQPIKCVISFNSIWLHGPADDPPIINLWLHGQTDDRVLNHARQSAFAAAGTQLE